MDGGVPQLQEQIAAALHAAAQTGGVPYGPGFSPPETGAFFYSKANASNTLPGKPTIPPLPAVT
jgi:hypothetical protein